MVEITINGRLGNQLFMYAMARTAQLESNNDLIYINTSIIESEGCNNSLSNYAIPDFVKFYSKPLRTLKNGLHTSFFTNYILMNYRKKTMTMNEKQALEYEIKNDKNFRKYGFFPCHNLYRKLDFSGSSNILLHGYYQSEKFFSKYKDIIINELLPKEPVLEHNKEKLNDIINSESVCVSLRLGEDYTKNEMYNVCTKEYFRNAIDLIKKKVTNPVFYVFSDVTEGLSEFFDNNDKMVIESGNDPDYEKLRIMSSCKHFIISNSSFSWWAQYMSDNKGKIVISPDRWYNNEIATDIMMDDWIRLNT